MPKFNLYPRPLPNQPDGVDTRLEVGWSKDTLTVAATRLQPNADRDREYFTAADGQSYRAWDGPFIDLDRGQVNELIRALREARDKAYGRDE